MNSRIGMRKACRKAFTFGYVDSSMDSVAAVEVAGFESTLGYATIRTCWIDRMFRSLLARPDGLRCRQIVETFDFLMTPSVDDAGKGICDSEISDGSGRDQWFDTWPESMGVNLERVL